MLLNALHSYGCGQPASARSQSGCRPAWPRSGQVTPRKLPGQAQLETASSRTWSISLSFGLGTTNSQAPAGPAPGSLAPCAWSCAIIRAVAKANCTHPQPLSTPQSGSQAALQSDGLRWGGAKPAGRYRGRSGSICGGRGAGPPAPEPLPAAAQRLPTFLWQPAASQPVWRIPPTLGRSLARIELASGLRQAEQPPRIGLYRPGWEE
jgi:hypothetical protein